MDPNSDNSNNIASSSSTGMDDQTPSSTNQVHDVPPTTNDYYQTNPIEQPNMNQPIENQMPQIPSTEEPPTTNPVYNNPFQSTPTMSMDKSQSPFNSNPVGMANTPANPTPETPAPAVNTFTYNQEPEPMKKSSHKKVVILALVIFLFLAVGLSFAGATMVAYEKIPVKNENLKTRISNFVFSVPFLPKTPKYILLTAIKSDKNVVSGYLDASFAAKGNPINELYSSIGIENIPLEMTIKGPYDYTDSQNPKSEMNINFANQFEMDASTIDGKAYMRINKLPTVLIGLMGVANPESFDALLHKWVYFDSSQLGSDAAASLNENSKNYAEEELKKYNDFMENVLEEDILPYMVLTDDKIDQKSMYKLSVDLTPEEFATIAKSVLTKGCKEFSNEIKSTSKVLGAVNTADIKAECDFSDIQPPKELKVLTFDLWIEPKTYYIKKIEGYAKIAVDNTGSNPNLPTFFSGDPNIEIQATINITKQNEKFDIKAPEGAIDFETYMKQVGSMFGYYGTNDSTAVTQAQFAKIKSDVSLVQSNLVLFKTTNGKYPTTITELFSLETGSQIAQIVSESRIKYVVIPDQSTYLLYSTIQDPSNTESPYFAIDSSPTGIHSANHTGEELNGFIKGMGFSEDLELSTSSPTMSGNTLPLMY